MNTQSFYRTGFPYESNQTNDTVSLQVNCTGIVSQKKPFRSKGVRLDYYYLYLWKGTLIMPDCTMEPGDVMIMEPNRPYQYESLGETVYLWVHFTGNHARSHGCKAVGLLNVKRHIGTHWELKDCFQKMFHEFIVNDSRFHELSACLLQEILLLTERYAELKEMKALPLKALDYLHSHFREEVSVPDLAKLEQVSTTTFRTMFQSHTGVSPNTYLIALRMEEACRMLKQTDFPISDVALEVGYADPYYFSRIFKKKIGFSPLKYRKEA